MSFKTQSPFVLPHDYTRIKVVHSFDELVGTPFGDGVNALCWQRTIEGDYEAIVQQLVVQEGLNALDESVLNALDLSPAGRVAAETLMADYRMLQEHGLEPVLDCIRGYPHDDPAEIVATDVYSFHVDSAPVEADTYLCTYYGASSEGLRNDDAIRKVDIPETRARLLAQFGGTDDEEFAEYLNENCYDLHYGWRPQAEPFAFGLGNLWRIATEYPESPVPPCVHRAPLTRPGELRLLLIS